MKRMEGDGNAELTSAQRRVLLEMMNKKYFVLSFIVFVCCTVESGGNYAEIRPFAYAKQLERQYFFYKI